jgi:demethylmenaquinone methyltransferase/2-methoxy-6-polyprenyl-1,4-benzoquinol methylase
MTDEERNYYALMLHAFKTLAPVYDLISLPFVRLRQTAVEFAGAPAGARVLDVATGTGSQAIAFARRGYAVTAIDLSEPMLAVGQRKKGSGLVRFQAGNATRLRFAADSFDVVTISFALHDMPAAIRERALMEMLRVARPGATILIVDYALPANPLGRRLVYRLIRLYEGPYYEAFVRFNLQKTSRPWGSSSRGSGRPCSARRGFGRAAKSDESVFYGFQIPIGGSMTLADVRSTFDEWAPFYNPTHSWIPGRRAARLALTVRPGDRVLDLACGTGLNFSHLRALVGENRVVGVDLSPQCWRPDRPHARGDGRTSSSGGGRTPCLSRRRPSIGPSAPLR